MIVRLGQLGFHTQAAVGERFFKLLVGHLVESPVEITLDRALHRSRVHNSPLFERTGKVEKAVRQ